MKKIVLILAVVSLIIAFPLSVSAEELIRFVNIDKVGDKVIIKAHVLRPVCPPGNGPWVGLSIKASDGKVIDLPAYGIENEKTFEWGWRILTNTDFFDYSFTAAVWCGRECKDRYQNPRIENHPNVIRWQPMGTGSRNRY